MSAAALRIDVHTHLAGVGTGKSGCWVSPSFRQRLTYRLLRLLHGIDEREGRDVDAEWAERLAGFVRESELDHAVALGFDAVYDEDGHLDREHSQMVVPPAWTFEVCRRHPELLPGPSVHPLRPDALERLDECVERGAVLIKWLPATHAIDPADRRLLPFYRRLADAGLPLLVHAGGGERTFAELRPELKDLRRLRLPLEEGVRVICAHAATPVLLSGDENQVPLLGEMMGHYPHLWTDNSGIANPSRFPWLPRIADDAAIRERTLHGSDFPVPTGAFYYPRRLGLRAVLRLQRVRNPLQRNLELKRAIGFDEQTLTRAAGVLRL